MNNRRFGNHRIPKFQQPSDKVVFRDCLSLVDDPQEFHSFPIEAIVLESQTLYSFLLQTILPLQRLPNECQVFSLSEVVSFNECSTCLMLCMIFAYRGLKGTGVYVFKLEIPSLLISCTKHFHVQPLGYATESSKFYYIELQA